MIDHTQKIDFPLMEVILRLKVLTWTSFEQTQVEID